MADEIAEALRLGVTVYQIDEEAFLAGTGGDRITAHRRLRLC
jgi:hypothetical protein